MNQINNFLYSKLIKLFNIKLYIILRSTCLPKCIIRYIITKFCTPGKLLYNVIKKTEHNYESWYNSTERSSNTNIYHIYYPGAYYYTDKYKISERSLIIDKYFGNLRKFYIDEKFIVRPSLLVYNISGLNISDRNIIATIKIIVELCGDIDKFLFPIFPENYVEIMEENKNNLVEVVQAEMTLIKLRSEKKRIKNIINLI